MIQLKEGFGIKKLIWFRKKFSLGDFMAVSHDTKTACAIKQGGLLDYVKPIIVYQICLQSSTAIFSILYNVIRCLFFLINLKIHNYWMC